MPQRLQRYVRNGLVSLVPLDIRRPSPPSGMRFKSPGHNDAAEVAWVSGFEFPSLIGEFTIPNKNNDGPICQTPGVSAVNSLGTDASGNLWVPAGNNGPPTGSTQQFTCSGGVGLSIPDPYGQPGDVTFDSKGDIIVGNTIDYAPFNGGYYIVAGTANIYSASGVLIGGFSDPSFSAPHPPGFDNFNELIGVAVDAHDNCYVSHYDLTGAGEVVEFPSCKPANKGKILAGPHPWSPGKPQFDAAGNLVITDFATADFYHEEYVSIYAPPYDKPATKTFKLIGASISCPLSSDQKSLYCANVYLGSVDVYSYPAGKYQYSFNKGLQTYGATGIALAPAGSK
ncbi:MAG TPA: hypothetical protein VGF98_14260 [Candidatus Tumulicola sp.]